MDKEQYEVELTNKVNELRESSRSGQYKFYIDKLVITGYLEPDSEFLFGEIIKQAQIDLGLKQDNKLKATTVLIDNSPHEYVDESVQVDEIRVEDDNSVFYVPEYEERTKNIKQKMYIDKQQLISNKLIKITFNPNRFVGDLNNEYLLKLMVNDLFPLLDNKAMGHIDLNMDIAYEARYLIDNFSYKGAKSVHVHEEFDESKGIRDYQSKKITINKEREIIIYDKLKEIKENVKDDSFINKRFANELMNNGESMTRIEIRALNRDIARKFMSNPKSLAKDFEIVYRDRSKEAKPNGFGDLSAFLNGKDKPKLANKEASKRFKTVINKGLEQVRDDLKGMDYLSSLWD